MEETKSSKVKAGDMATVLLSTGVVADALSLIPFVGAVVGPVYWFFAGIYLWACGHGLISAKKLVPIIVSMIAEFFPAIQSAPTIVIGIVIILVSIKLEEKTGVNVLKNPTSIKNIKNLPGQLRNTQNQITRK